ncbi:FMN-binding negative transcriptional regulator [Amycolatopsis acidicola]|uniref:FMN-binding negative transcriptional regulator n=1 Tax=Amycolatopsis acidicola TaxID=2596893 RepID=A0A5N0UZY2_9PSEU|nr:FMN-binding negative transcriptional regulator [Amycolatopsis acidicola]KAA9155791.1 FMN-binding negative transcriptional regulator [Amycolatopsis acidicola]
MHEFEPYRPAGPGDEAELVRRNPFALVVSGGEPPVATHTPVILPGPALDGATLLGHMARANPHWRAFGRELLVVFSGPHGYVSPTAYGYNPAVPTWNYAAVHVTGPVEVITDRDETLDVVEKTVLAAEAPRDPAWDPTSSREQFRAIVDGVVAFRVHVREVRSNFKFSQDKPEDVRARVREDQRAHGDGAAADFIS